VNEHNEPRWPRLLLALGLLLVAVLCLLLVSGVFSGLVSKSPLSGMPAPTTPTVTRVPPPRATVEGLEESSGPTVSSQEGQEGRPRVP